MQLVSSQEYANFRAWVPRNKVTVGVQHPQSWLYYDWGPRSYPEPIVCFHALIGSPESFFHQVIALAPRGYRILSLQIPAYWTISDYCDALHAFLDMLNLSRIHVYGAGLGAFLAMHYAVRRPDRIASIILTHAFLSTEGVCGPIPYSPSVLRWLPDIFVRSTMRALLPKGRATPMQAYAAEFAIGHTISLSRELLAARLALLVSGTSIVSRLHIAEARITFVDTLDRPQAAIALSERTASQVPNARRAFLKFGGDFPYLSVPEDVNVHLVVHLRRHAAKPTSPMAVPPPARPHPILQKAPPRPARASQGGGGGGGDGGDGSDSGDRAALGSPLVTSPKPRKRRTHEEIVAEAQAIVSADERAAIERYAFEINRLKEFLPDHDDAYLATVLLDCDGSLDRAISNALSDEYDDSFYTEVHERAVDDTVASLRRTEDTEEDISTIASPSPSPSPAPSPSHPPDMEHLGAAEKSGERASEEDVQASGDGLGASADNIGLDGRGDVIDITSAEDDISGDGERLRDADNQSGRGRRSASVTDAYGGLDRPNSMRPTTPLVGRGPAPFRSMSANDESWVLAPPQAEDDATGSDSVTGERVSSADPLASADNAHRSGTDGKDNKRDALFSWKGVLPRDGRGPSRELAPGNSSDDEDPEHMSWDHFRKRETSSDSNVLNPNETTEGKQANSSADASAEKDSVGESEEQRRLRLWSMSAVAAASKSVHR